MQEDSLKVRLFDLDAANGDARCRSPGQDVRQDVTRLIHNEVDATVPDAGLADRADLGDRTRASTEIAGSSQLDLIVLADEADQLLAGALGFKLS